MEGKKIVIFLKTPLYRFKYSIEGEEKQLINNAIHIEGDVVKEKQAGLLMKVSEISSMREKQKDLPFSELFVPFDKVDFLIAL